MHIKATIYPPKHKKGHLLLKPLGLEAGHKSYTRILCALQRFEFKIIWSTALTQLKLNPLVTDPRTKPAYLSSQWPGLQSKPGPRRTRRDALHRRSNTLVWPGKMRRVDKPWRVLRRSLPILQWDKGNLSIKRARVHACTCAIPVSLYFFQCFHVSCVWWGVGHWQNSAEPASCWRPWTLK